MNMESTKEVINLYIEDKEIFNKYYLYIGKNIPIFLDKNFIINKNNIANINLNIFLEMEQKYINDINNFFEIDDNLIAKGVVICKLKKYDNLLYLNLRYIPYNNDSELLLEKGTILGYLNNDKYIFNIKLGKKIDEIMNSKEREINYLSVYLFD